LIYGLFVSMMMSSIYYVFKEHNACNTGNTKMNIPTFQQDEPCLSTSAVCAVARLRLCVHAVVVWIPTSARMARTGLRAGHRRW
jgi:hypothetical protein